MPRQIARAGLFAVLLLAAGAGRAAAQDSRALCAERPGKATPPCILDVGRVQAEVGLVDGAFSRGGGESHDVYALAAAELRFGLTSRSEAEVGWTPLIVDHLHGRGTRSGVGDLTFGGRVALTEPGADALVSAQAFVNAPTATHGMGGGGWTGGARLPFAMPLPGDFGLGGSPEVDLVRDADGHGVHLAWSAALGVSRALGPLTLDAELWGLVDRDPAAHTREASVDLTAAYMVGPDLQLDAGANLGLNHATPDVEAYVGVARRF
jgi:hypothetical protein